MTLYIKKEEGPLILNPKSSRKIYKKIRPNRSERKNDQINFYQILINFFLKNNLKIKKIQKFKKILKLKIKLFKNKSL